MSHAYDLVKEWDLRGIEPIGGGNFNLIVEKLETFRRTHYDEYVPCLSPEYPDFMVRLDEWLDNVNGEEEKRTMLEFAPQILFFGRGEFLELHQSAYRGPITRWIIDELALLLDDPALADRVEQELHEHTWYCPITDSMQISDFHHANQIGGIDYRPDFRSLTKFGDPQKVIEFMGNHKNARGEHRPLRRIVLLEDFVGSGTQIDKTIPFAASLPGQIPILFVPLIICPAGAEAARDMQRRYANVRYEPVIELEENLFINRHTYNIIGPLEKKVKDLAESTYPMVKGDDAYHPRPYSPFGCWETGATVIMYSNAPANTLPMLQHRSNSWTPLFPRSARIR